MIRAFFAALVEIYFAKGAAHDWHYYYQPPRYNIRKGTMSCIDHGKKGLPKLPYAIMRRNGKGEYMHRLAYADRHGLSIDQLKVGMCVTGVTTRVV